MTASKLGMTRKEQKKRVFRDDHYANRLRPVCSWINLFPFCLSPGSLIVYAIASYTVVVFFIEASILMTLQMVQPVLTMIISVATRTEPFPSLRRVHGWAKLLAIASTVGGSILIVVETSSSHKDQTTNQANDTCSDTGLTKHSKSEMALAYFGLLSNITSFCIYVVLQKKLIFQNPKYLRWKQRPVTLTAWQLLLGYPVQLAFFPMAGMMETSCGDGIGPFTLRGRAIWALEYQIVMVAVIGVLVMSWCNSRLQPSLMTVWIPVTVSEPCVSVVKFSFPEV